MHQLKLITMTPDSRDKYIRICAQNELINRIVDDDLSKDQLVNLKNEINNEHVEYSFAFFKDNLPPRELKHLNESFKKGKYQAKVDFARNLIEIGFDKRKALDITNLNESQYKDYCIPKHINPYYDYLHKIGFNKGKLDENRELEKKYISKIKKE